MFVFVVALLAALATAAQPDTRSHRATALRHISTALFHNTTNAVQAAEAFFARADTSSSLSSSSSLPDAARHTNNWAVLVCTSRFWFNYRHIANTLSLYRTVKRLGIPDSNIILMLADDVACNARNRFPATVYNNNRRFLDLYGTNVEVDYRGYEVTVENFIRLLTGRVHAQTPRSKRLLTDDRSNILVFLTGHGGEDFLKFQDAEELGAQDLADAFAQMHEKKRYHEILFMIDTCQAASMYSQIYSPNILAAASSLVGESSYSHHLDFELGVSVIDRFTYYNLEILERLHRDSQDTLHELFSTYSYENMHSHVGIRSDLFQRPLDKTLVTDFFGGIQSIELTESYQPLTKRSLAPKPSASDPVEPTHAATATETPIGNRNNIRPVAKQPINFSTEFILGIAVLGAAALVCIAL